MCVTVPQLTGGRKLLPADVSSLPAVYAHPPSPQLEKEVSSSP